MLQTNSKLKSHIVSLWNTFWSAGLSNPITAIEQISYFLFIRQLDELEKKSASSKFDGEYLPYIDKKEYLKYVCQQCELEARLHELIVSFYRRDGRLLSPLKLSSEYIKSIELINKDIQVTRSSDIDFDLKMIADFFRELDRQGPGGVEQTLRALEFVPDRPGMRIADIGCGTGGQTARR